MTFVAKTSHSSSQARKPLTNARSNNRDGPYYTHCKLQGQVMDKCYKLHRYPPGYKYKNRVAAVQAHDDPSDQISSINNDLSNMLNGFYQEQCQ